MSRLMKDLLCLVKVEHYPIYRRKLSEKTKRKVGRYTCVLLTCITLQPSKHTQWHSGGPKFFPYLQGGQISIFLRYILGNGKVSSLLFLCDFDFLFHCFSSYVFQISLVLYMLYVLTTSSTINSA